MLIALTLTLTMLMLMGHLATCLAQPNNSKPQALLHLMINTDMYICTNTVLVILMGKMVIVMQQY